MRRIILIYLLLILVFSTNLFAQRKSNTKPGIAWMNVDYAGDSIIGHKMDIFLPNKIKGTFPAVIIIYGSAWFNNNGKVTAFKLLGQSLLDNGFAVVAINHRSSKDAKYPAQIHDVKAAIRYIRGNAKKYSIDPSFIGITGYSSGGHLATLAGTTGGVNNYKVQEKEISLEGEVGNYLKESSKVNAVVDWYGPTDLLIMDSCGSKMAHNAATSPESSLIGGTIQENKSMAMLANPITYIDANDPPFLIIHGDADESVPYCQSAKLHEALQKKGIQNKYILVPGAGHGPGLHERQYFDEMTNFFKEELVKKAK